MSDDALKEMEFNSEGTAARMLLEMCRALRAERDLLKLRVAELEARLAMKGDR